MAHRLDRSSPTKHRRPRLPRVPATAPARLVLPAERVPQLREVDQRVHALTGFHIRPVPGLVPTTTFYGALADRTFLSTQYIRHHSVPFYTPEPDIVHEIIGHANMLGVARASPTCTRPPATPRVRAESRRGARILQPGVLVHARVRRGVGGRRARRPTAPGCCRRSARSRPSGTPRSGRGTSRQMGTLELRHHPLPAGPVRRAVVRSMVDRAARRSSTTFDDDARTARTSARMRHRKGRRDQPRPTPTDPRPDAPGWDCIEFWVGNARTTRRLPHVGVRVLLHRLRRARDGRRDEASYVLEQGAIRFVVTGAPQPPTRPSPRTSPPTATACTTWHGWSTTPPRPRTRAIGQRRPAVRATPWTEIGRRTAC